MPFNYEQAIQTLTHLYATYAPNAGDRQFNIDTNFGFYEIGPSGNLPAPQSQYDFNIQNFIIDAGFYENAFPGHAPVFDISLDPATVMANQAAYVASLPSDLVVDFFYPTASPTDRTALISALDSGALTNESFASAIGEVAATTSTTSPSAAAVIAEAASPIVGVTNAGTVTEPVTTPVTLPDADLGITGISDYELDFLVSMYVGAFGRAPEHDGLAWWANDLATKDAAGQANSLVAISNSMYAEGAKHGEGGTSLSNEDYVSFAYQNSLGRAPDAGGYDYWVSGLNNGTVARGDFLASFLGGALDHSNDSAYVGSRVAVAKFAAQENVSGPHAKGIDLWGVLDNVHDDATALSAINSIKSNYGILSYGTSAGDDSATLSGNSADYTIETSGDLVTVTSAHDKESYVGVEYLQFDDKVVSIPADSGNSDASGATATPITLSGVVDSGIQALGLVA